MRVSGRSSEECEECRSRLHRLLHVLIPPLRAYVRHAPAWLARGVIWRRVVEPHLSSHSHPFTVRTVYGPKLVGNQRWIMHRCIYYFGLWEPALTRWILDTLQPGDTFVDVGANIGYFSVLAAERVGKSGSVVAIEPSPTTFARLQANIQSNRLSNVRAVQAATAQAQHAIPFYRASNDAESSTLPIPGTTYEADVPAAPLAQLLTDEELAHARLIKIDVEGAELDVVAGLVPALGRMRPDAEVAIEVHPHLMTGAESSPEDLRDLSESLGFRPYYLPVDFSTNAHLDPPSLRPIRLTEPRNEMVHLIFSRQRSAEL